MRKLSLSILALFFQLFSAFSQSDTSAYKQRKLKPAEVNFITSYYVQDGENAAVTGGVGSEKLTDFANILELKIVGGDKRERQHNLTLDVGFDHYSSASSDKVDPTTLSSASSEDGRFYPSITYDVTNKAKTLTAGGIASFSIESDYTSYGIGTNIIKTSKDKNTEIGLKLQAYFDYIFIYYPIELRYFYGDGDQAPRTTYNASLSFARVITPRLQCALLADVSYQDGLLATRFQRVYFKDGSVQPETLPNHRLKLPLGLRASYFLSNHFIARLFYRFYIDDWGITAHTASLEAPIKIAPTLSISPFYRYYVQSGAKYFAPFREHVPTDAFYTSDYDLSAFDSHFFGGNLRFEPEKGVLGIKHFKMLELRYAHYLRSTGLFADIITLNAQFR
ncbi:MAG: hypothetical protein K0Q79_2665 [Flavipsychrobacter sp.]|jgi:hypothetical protein|nr:hypothetical protein [Flavipsychrobacter sp.]